jgi:pyrimidine oxygenase
VTGWQEREYSQMGLWAGEEHYKRRYRYAAEYVQVLPELWFDGISNFHGDYFHLDDCRLLPRPKGRIGVVCAGQSDTGIDFCAHHGDINFVVATGVNEPNSVAATNERVRVAAARAGREVGTYVLLMIVSGETDDEAWAKWNRYRDGIDVEALLWGSGQASLDTHSSEAASSMHLMRNNVGAVNMGMGVLIGSFDNVARMMDEVAAVPGTRGIMIAFGEPVQGIVDFGERIQPLMASRVGVLSSQLTPTYNPDNSIYERYPCGLGLRVPEGPSRGGCTGP